MSFSQTIVLPHSQHSASSVKKCAGVFRSGGVVVVPTETVYGVAALLSCGNAIQKLLRAKNRAISRTLAIAVADWQMAKRFTAESDGLAAKLARLYWPGPLTLVVKVKESIEEFPSETRAAVAPIGTIGLRAPRNSFLLDVLRELNEPIALTSANISGEPPATTANDARVALGDRVDLIVDGGNAPLGIPSTVVQIVANDFEILREGGISHKAISEARVKTILFLCTGNVCRSPMAEALCKQIVQGHVAKKDLNRYRVLSAGIEASPGDPASQYACETLLNDYNIPISGWRSRKINYRLLDEADVIYCMDRSHLVALHNLYPECEERARLLALDGSDIKEPQSETFADYRSCAQQIVEALRLRIEDVIKL